MTSANDSKIKALSKLKEDLETKFGSDSIMLIKDIPTRSPVSSGSLALDFACGIGGFPSDRCIEIYGTPGVGKTTLGLLAMSKFLDADPERGALILDLEHKITPSWAEQLIGTERMDRIIHAWADSAEEATDIYLKAVSSGLISFVLFDSIGGAPTQRVLNKSAEIGNIGGNALAITRFAQLASIYSQKYHTLTLGINQARDNLGYGGGISTPGGHAWRHACVIRIYMRRASKDNIEEVVCGEKIPVGHKIVAKVMKNQLAAPGREAWWWLYHIPNKYGFGIDTLDEIVRLSITTEVIRQGGAWYHHPMLPDGKIQSRESLVEYVRGNEDLQYTLTSQVMQALSQGGEELVNRVAPISNVEAEIPDAQPAVATV